MLKYVLYFVLLLFGIAIYTSCNYLGGGSKGENKSTSSLLDKSINFPTSLLELDGTEFKPIDSFITKTKNKAKIISIIDGNCVKCIVMQMNKIDSIFNSIMHNKSQSLIFVLNVNKEDSIFFMRNLQPIIDVKNTILWDNAFNFEFQNELLSYDLNDRIFMVNKENKIILVGNPLMYPDLILEYKEKLIEDIPN